ncbi:hypothetical protein F4802DRAFT_592419 [Xylaria palmicola]|nr:hypothetical protein F4802DRAFT_592419 [Xylaria palmicola]
MRPNPTDNAMWDKRHPFLLAALKRRKLAKRTKESTCKAVGPNYLELILNSVRRPQSLGSAAPNYKGGTQQRPDGHYLSQRPQKGQTSILILPDNKSNNLGGLQPNTIVAIQHLHYTETQDKDVNKEDIVQPFASKRRKLNKHPFNVEPPAKPQLDNSTRMENEDSNDTCQPPSKRCKENSFTKLTILRPPTQRHFYLDNTASRLQPVQTRSPSLRRGGVAGPHFIPKNTLIKLTDDNEFEKILRTRKQGRGHQVLVKWTYFEKPTWEPIKNFLKTEAL